MQTNTQSGELSQRFIEFVMMQAQNAALFLGQIPNPQTGQGEVNLELAKMFIDQLAMIQEKTRGNLTSEETAVLRNTLSNLQMAFVEVSQQSGEGRSRRRSRRPRPRDAGGSGVRFQGNARRPASVHQRDGIAQEIHEKLRRVGCLSRLCQYVLPS